MGGPGQSLTDQSASYWVSSLFVAFLKHYWLLHVLNVEDNISVRLLQQGTLVLTVKSVCPVPGYSCYVPGYL